MPTYEFKCFGCNSISDVTVVSYNLRPKTLPCECGEMAVPIISKPHFTVDNTDRQGFNHGAGRYFSNKGEIKEFCRAHNVQHGPMESDSKIKQRRKELKERRAEEKLSKHG
jgi:hypothetical protein